MLVHPMCLESYCHFLSLVFKDYPPTHPGIYTLIYRAISEHLLTFSFRNRRGTICFCHVSPTNLQNGFLGLTEREGKMYEDVCIVMDNMGTDRGPVWKFLSRKSLWRVFSCYEWN